MGEASRDDVEAEDEAGGVGQVVQRVAVGEAEERACGVEVGVVNSLVQLGAGVGLEDLGGVDSGQDGGGGKEGRVVDGEVGCVHGEGDV